MIVAIGIDPGNHSGAAAVVRDSRGKIVLSTSKANHAPRDTEFDVERWRSYEAWLMGFLHETRRAFEGEDPDIVIGFEDVKGHRGRKAAQVYGGYRALTLNRLAGELGLPVCLVHTGTLKKYATGDGRATKNQMWSAVKGVTGVNRSELNHDEVDAIHLARYTLDHEDEWRVYT